MEKGLTINDQSFDVSGFSQTIPTQTLTVGQTNTVKLTAYENSGIRSLRCFFGYYRTIKESKTKLKKQESHLRKTLKELK